MIGIILYCFGMYLIAGIGASLGYHRVLTHKAAEMPKWVEYSIVFFGLPAGTPIQWVGNHRAHHNKTDENGDPHSPHVDGFWYAHCGWYIQTKNWFVCLLYTFAGPFRMLFDSFMRPRTNQQHVHLAKDIEADTFYSFISQPIVYMVILWIYLIVIFVPAFLFFGWNGIFAATITLIAIYNIGDAVDSFGHLYGEKTGKDESRNNVLLGVLAYGDGWHSNHHKNPKSAKHGIKKGQLDFTYIVLRIGKFIGLIKKIN